MTKGLASVQYVLYTNVYCDLSHERKIVSEMGSSIHGEINLNGAAHGTK